MIRIAFTGGGTGGHIYPALAVIEAMRKLDPPVEVFWIGNDEGMDRAIVEAAGVEFRGVPSGKFRRELSLKNLTDLGKIARGYFAARNVLRERKPDLLFSKGGFVSVPPVRAAASLGIPVYAHESDVTPGLATRLNLKAAERVYVAYERTKTAMGEAVRDRVVVSGNPVRAAFRSGNRARGLDFAKAEPGKPVVLVLGGSQGARQVNGLVEATRERLSSWCTIVHQVGEKNWSDEVASRAALSYRPFPYISSELPDVLAAADLVVSRAGAGSLWECAAAGKPMLLVPLSGAGTRGDQVLNAAEFASRGAAQVLDGERVTADEFLGALTGLLGNPEKLASMAAAVSLFAGKNASESIARDLVERAGKRTAKLD